ncbi:MAG: peptidase [Planctomycetaceae bacterium]|nr:peptidase [Planctomycetaceae bacterium]
MSEHQNLSRREFTKTALVGTAAVLGTPMILTAKKTEAKTAIVGEGEHRYECHHNWGTLPNGHEYGGASHGTAVDKQGRIYITHHGGPGSIFVFDEDGKFIKSMGEVHRTRTQGVGHGIDIREENGQEFLYLSPNNPAFGFAKTDLNGEIVWQKDRKTIEKDSGKYAKGARFNATNVNFNPDGGYYLGDGYGSGWIHHYDKNDKYVSSFGGTGTADGKFRTPHGQWLDDRDGTPKIVVCDRANARLQWFDLEGNFLKKMDGFLFPADIDIQGDIMLVPDLHCRVTLLDKDNKVLAQLGDDAEWRKLALSNGFKMRSQPDQWKPGKFVHPHDACFDKDGNIFVAEWVKTGRVTKLSKVS